MGEGTTSARRDGRPLEVSAFQIVFAQGKDVELVVPREATFPEFVFIVELQRLCSPALMWVPGLMGENGAGVGIDAVRHELCCPSVSHEARRAVVGFCAGLLVTFCSR